MNSAPNNATTRAHIERHIRAAMTRMFRTTTKCDVSFNPRTETWSVQTDVHVFTFQCGSDDDMYIFTDANSIFTITVPFIR